MSGETKTVYKRPVCRGSWALGTACGRCERCLATRPTPTVEGGELVERLRNVLEVISPAARTVEYVGPIQHVADVARALKVVENGEIKDLLTQAADALASRDAEIERLRQAVTLQEIDRKANLHAAREQLRENSAEFKKLNAALGEAEDAMTDARAGWRYIRDHHGDLYGVGWDRVENKLNAALSTLKTAKEGNNA